MSQEGWTHWVGYLFGAFLLLTGVKMAIQQKEREIDPEQHLELRLLRRFLLITERYEDGKFFV